ncbi:MAG: YqgE/AlgH family protein [Bacteroidota bacterium]|nr:transcriptional regulator [Odoribacter sp.]MDP3644361.1 YqgE/AlgH family protein [Bacteroidota bacterium]
MKINTNIFRIETNHVAPSQGHILIAEPFLAGSYFNRSIILLASYGEKGAVGFILNKKVDYPVEDLFANFPDFDSEIHIGGPVGTDSIYFIHTLGDSIPGSIKIKENLYWGGDFEALKLQIKLGLVNSQQVRFFLGYSGWDAGQLEEEIAQNSWLVADIPQADLMTIDENVMWAQSVRSMGGKYSMWENFPENPSLN